MEELRRGYSLPCGGRRTMRTNWMSAAIRCMKMRAKNGQNRFQTVTLITCSTNAAVPSTAIP